MEINLLAPLLLVPSQVYFFIHPAHKQSGQEAARALGWTLPIWRDLGEAALVLLVLAVLATVAFRLTPLGALQVEDMNTATYEVWLRNLSSLALIFLLNWLTGRCRRRYSSGVG